VEVPLQRLSQSKITNKTNKVVDSPAIRRNQRVSTKTELASRVVLNSRNLSTSATRVTSLSLAMSIRLPNNRPKPLKVDLLLNFQLQQRVPLELKTNLRVFRRTKKKRNPSLSPRDLPSSLALSRVS
jgi:hypothetical protein